jgi:DNA-binding transcriptional ArsR family regulator
MGTEIAFVEIAAAAGDPARARMLHALMDGRALTAGELARAASITPQTASGHLARMVGLGLLRVEKQGKHRYHRLASAAVAHMLESLMQFATQVLPAAKPLTVGPREAALRTARTCYDHLAGRLGVALADCLCAEGHVIVGEETADLTAQGLAFLVELGLDPDRLTLRPGARSGRILCRPCLDWSERRPHLAGVVGAALCSHAVTAGWIRRVPESRAIVVTPKGARIFRDRFRLPADWASVPMKTPVNTTLR